MRKAVLLVSCWRVWRPAITIFACVPLSTLWSWVKARWFLVRGFEICCVVLVIFLIGLVRESSFSTSWLNDCWDCWRFNLLATLDLTSFVTLFYLGICESICRHTTHLSALPEYATSLEKVVQKLPGQQFCLVPTVFERSTLAWVGGSFFASLKVKHFLLVLCTESREMFIVTLDWIVL